MEMVISKKELPDFAAAAAKSLQSCPTLCDPIDGSPPGSPIPGDSPGKNTGVGCHGLLQCMTGKVKGKSLSRVRLFPTPWTAAYQAPPPMGFSRQEDWSGLPLCYRGKKQNITELLWVTIKSRILSYYCN